MPVPVAPMARIPHITQYQGSKRRLAPLILRWMPARMRRLVEPFAGMAAVSVAAAAAGRAESFHLNDINAPLADLLREAVEHPQALLERYEALWKAQFAHPEGHIRHFHDIRDAFNAGNRAPERMLYLLARCVKGAVRYSRAGDFNQSPDRRRHGTSPEALGRNLPVLSALLAGRTTFSSLDYREVLESVRPGDLVYMDPPYQGVVSTRDRRYRSGIDADGLIAALNDLNRRGIDFLVSYDGTCGGRSYGADLPAELGCRRIPLDAGPSSQATLLGRSERTCEALYLSRKIAASAEAG